MLPAKLQQRKLIKIHWAVSRKLKRKISNKKRLSYSSN